MWHIRFLGRLDIAIVHDAFSGRKGTFQRFGIGIWCQLGRGCIARIRERIAKIRGQFVFDQGMFVLPADNATGVRIINQLQCIQILIFAVNSRC